MSVEISVSSNKQKNCNDILEKLLKSGIDCRIIETVSIVDNNIENGCLISLGHQYYEKKKIQNIWNIIKDNYNCSHLKIDGIFNGCIYNYINADFCK